MSVADSAFDEFSHLTDSAAQVGIALAHVPPVRREFVAVDDERRLSAIVWGDGAPELVFVHGAGQNAHTWDTVALLVGCPAVAVDLPGHGHSDGPRDGANIGPDADDVAVVVHALAPGARMIVGMSRGGLASIAVAGRAPQLVRALTLVDVTPGPHIARTQAIRDFLDGPPTFASLDEMVERALGLYPDRPRASLERSVRLNAVQAADGRWAWRHAGRRPPPLSPQDKAREAEQLWRILSGLTVPVMLVRGMGPMSVLGDADEAALLRSQPSARIARVAGAGHNVQGDAPGELAVLISSRLADLDDGHEQAR